MGKGGSFCLLTSNTDFSLCIMGIDIIQSQCKITLNRLVCHCVSFWVILLQGFSFPILIPVSFGLIFVSTYSVDQSLCNSTNNTGVSEREKERDTYIHKTENRIVEDSACCHFVCWCEQHWEGL